MISINDLFNMICTEALESYLESYTAEGQIKKLSVLRDFGIQIKEKKEGKAKK